ncbi:activating signal cointegrator 1 complex subunit 1 protein [Rutstroemia sp. NJR-2017a BVV2]|nr:activating signal cointegrator 1 complex subunit 1 protein [Rutstroemia sp. NJR-2017a BVV2]
MSSKKRSRRRLIDTEQHADARFEEPYHIVAVVVIKLKFKADVTSTSTLPPTSSTFDPEEEDNGWPTSTSTQARSSGTSENKEGGGGNEEQKFSIPASAIRPLGTLHLTLGVMSLTTSELMRGAVALLRELDLSSLLSSPESSAPGIKEPQPGPKQPLTSPPKTQPTPQPLTITLRGLHSMHSPSSTSILYAAPISSPPDTLLTLCERLRERFMDAGFMMREERGLKLHATVVNTVYVKGGRDMGKGGRGRGRGRGGGGGTSGGKGDWGRGHGQRKAKITFDAREVLERYKDFEWMRDIRVEKVAICRMGAKKGEGGEEAYEVEAEVDM